VLVEDDVGASIGESTDGDELGEVRDVGDVVECDVVRNAFASARPSPLSLPRSWSLLSPVSLYLG
jgi:hypothetical protein